MKNSTLFIQYGSVRTGSTVQFKLLCLAARLLAKQRVPCQFGPVPQSVPQHGAVYKQHDTWPGFTPHARALVRNGRAMLFVSSADASETAAAYSAKLRAPVAYVQQLAAFNLRLRNGTAAGVHWLLEQYRPLLQLSERDAAKIREYLYHWDPLRLCCNYEMSRTYKAILLSYNGSGTRRIHSPHACDAINVTSHEEAVLKTGIVRAGLTDGEGPPGTCAELHRDLKRLVMSPHCERLFVQSFTGEKLRREIGRLRAADARGEVVPYHPEWCSRKPGARARKGQLYGITRVVR